MRIKVTRKLKVTAFLCAVILFCGIGMLMDRFAGGRYTIEKLPEGAENVSEAISPDAAVAPSETVRPDGLININRADAETLCTLSGIGEKTAEKIISYRETNGNFKAIEEITKVSGIGTAKFEKIKDKICVE